jgi:hypothetical protein
MEWSRSKCDEISTAHERAEWLAVSIYIISLGIGISGTEEERVSMQRWLMQKNGVLEAAETEGVFGLRMLVLTTYLLTQANLRRADTSVSFGRMGLHVNRLISGGVF